MVGYSVILNICLLWHLRNARGLAVHESVNNCIDAIDVKDDFVQNLLLDNEILINSCDPE